MSDETRVLVIGAGLTGCTLAHRLARAGVATTLLEREPAPGGLIRSEHMNGVLYEPHGSHIFHTEDEEVWSLANEMTPFNDYRHRVDIVADGQVLNWPILLSDIDRQSHSAEIHAQLEERRGVDSEARAQAANFEEWCLELMGPILYDRYIKSYTEKQWGRPAKTLSHRVRIRSDRAGRLQQSITTVGAGDTVQRWKGRDRSAIRRVQRGQLCVTLLRPCVASIDREHRRERIGCDVCSNEVAEQRFHALHAAAGTRRSAEEGELGSTEAFRDQCAALEARERRELAREELWQLVEDDDRRSEPSGTASVSRDLVYGIADPALTDREERRGLHDLAGDRERCRGTREERVRIGRPEKSERSHERGRGSESCGGTHDAADV